MKTVAIISEYNPFHNGHAYQIECIRKEFGDDTRIVAIMSGNFTQRAEPAILDKSIRAECAVRCGINLVLELPFPFSMSSAEFFAKSGVVIANAIKADYLSFGSECGDIELLDTVAKNMISEDFKTELVNSIKNGNKVIGYPALCEATYKKLYGTDVSNIFTPNNILALEYIKAIRSTGSNIKPHTIKRIGAGYNEENISDVQNQSATAIRNIMRNNFGSALNYVPKSTINTLVATCIKNDTPCDEEALSSAILSHFRLKRDLDCDIHDAEMGLYNRLKNAAHEAKSIKSLITLADTKKYTTARIRRVMWYSFFGVTSSDVKELPQYTQVLALDSVGQAILNNIKKTTDLPIITKPSSYDFLGDTAKRQKELSDLADSVFQLTKPSSPSGNTSLRTSPFVLK